MIQIVEKGRGGLGVAQDPKGIKKASQKGGRGTPNAGLEEGKNPLRFGSGKDFKGADDLAWVFRREATKELESEEKGIFLLEEAKGISFQTAAVAGFSQLFP
jgi:hypothetical protein